MRNRKYKMTQDCRSDEPMIGEYRKVPCVKLWKAFHGQRPGTWVPVIGPEHEDAEIINFPDDHWHIDWRFVSGRLWRTALETRVMHRTSFLHGIVITHQNTSSVTPELRRLLMKRSMPAHAVQQHRGIVPWMDKLEEKFKDTEMKCKTCPHRGLPLGSVRDSRGNYVCTGHGLRWNPRNGRLVTKELTA